MIHRQKTNKKPSKINNEKKISGAIETKHKPARLSKTEHERVMAELENLKKIQAKK